MPRRARIIIACTVGAAVLLAVLLNVVWRQERVGEPPASERPSSALDLLESAPEEAQVVVAVALRQPLTAREATALARYARVGARLGPEGGLAPPDLRDADAYLVVALPGGSVAVRVVGPFDAEAAVQVHAARSGLERVLLEGHAVAWRSNDLCLAAIAEHDLALGACAAVGRVAAASRGERSGPEPAALAGLLSRVDGSADVLAVLLADPGGAIPIRRAALSWTFSDAEGAALYVEPRPGRTDDLIGALESFAAFLAGAGLVPELLALAAPLKDLARIDSVERVAGGARVRFRLLADVGSAPINALAFLAPVVGAALRRAADAPAALGP